MLVDINKVSYQVNGDEFSLVPQVEYNNLIVLDNLSIMERICGLLGELCLIQNDALIVHNPTHGGYIPIMVANKYKTVYLINVSEEHRENIEKNISSQNIQNIKWELENTLQNCVVFSQSSENIDLSFVKKYHPLMINPMSTRILKAAIYKNILELTDSDLVVYVPDYCKNEFYETFKYYIQTINEEDVLHYDNLINMCIMVKNGGEQFEQMLQNNMQYIDEWTILDTGSTDNTIEIIERTLVGKKGKLYREPFINFRDSRNRLLELAGKSCKYTIMLDDTYLIKGDLRSFLNETRGDQFADSFTIYVKSDDVEYGSNRLLKTYKQLKYKYKIHEVVQDTNNVNVVIPFERAYILDGRFDYMEERTMKRKQLDIQLLQEEIDEDPDNPRSYYYMAQTYNLLGDFEKAYEYFMMRVDHPVEGFIQEKIDAIFEAARCAHFKINKPWEECKALYEKAYELDNSRPDSIYFIGIHYYMEGDRKTAYEYFKQAFEIGYPVHRQYSLKPTLSFHFLPKLLSQLCYEFGNFVLGEQCSSLYLSKNETDADQYSVISSWYTIFKKLNEMQNELTIKIEKSEKPLLCFVADGGFEPWSGSDILNKGLGGSETYIIEMARYIQKRGDFKVVVFCNCLEQSIFEGVEYIPIAQFMPFAKAKYIHTCIVSRFSEYLPVAIIGNVDNVYMVLHDLTPSGVVIPISNKLKKIFCLSEWHVNYFVNLFPECKNITVPFYYGIDIDKFNSEKIIENENEKENKDFTHSNIQLSIVESSPKTPYKFIYSSYPNRGLYELLLMWPSIVEKYPEASLHIYADVNGKWVNGVAHELMEKIKDLYSKYENMAGGLNIHKYGWVNKEILAESWKTAEYWLYPCTFMETFCLTALEAALSKTLAITNGLAALQNTVGDRGVCIEGDASTEEWRAKALTELFSVMENKQRKEDLIENNYEWAKKMSWENQAYKLLDEHFIPNALEYKGMYNWMHDLPRGTRAKERFEKAIKHYIDKNTNEEQNWILEVGVYTGTSLIEIVRAIPNSFGLGIDRWENYNENGIHILQNIEQNDIEKTFYKNVKMANLEDRIKAMKGKSSAILLELVKSDMQYDFIYVDGSHRCLDVYLDLFLSWQLLRKGGVLAIDDYMYNFNRVKELPYDYPLEAVDQFLKDYEGNYYLIDKDYRVFLEKTV